MTTIRMDVCIGDAPVLHARVNVWLEGTPGFETVVARRGPRDHGPPEQQRATVVQRAVARALAKAAAWELGAAAEAAPEPVGDPDRWRVLAMSGEEIGAVLYSGPQPDAGFLFIALVEYAEAPIDTSPPAAMVHLAGAQLAALLACDRLVLVDPEGQTRATKRGVLINAGIATAPEANP